MTKSPTKTTRNTKRTAPSRRTKRASAGLSKRPPASMELHSFIYLSDSDARREPIADRAVFQSNPLSSDFEIYLMRQGRFVDRVTIKNWGEAMRLAVKILYHGAPNEILPEEDMRLLERALAFQVTQMRKKQIEALCDEGKLSNDEGWKRIWKASRDPMVIEMPWEREDHERAADHILRESERRRESERIQKQLHAEPEAVTTEAPAATA